MIHGVKGYAMTGWRIGIAAAQIGWPGNLSTTSCANAIGADGSHSHGPQTTTTKHV